MKNFLFIVVCFSILPLGFGTIYFSKYGVSTDTSDWSNFGSFIGGTLSPILAFCSFVGLLIAIKVEKDQAEKSLKEQKDQFDRDKRVQDSLIYCQHAITCLERAYKVLSVNDSLTKPVKDRLAWLTCARLIMSSEDLYSRISEDAESVKLLYKGEAEFWRIKFYNLLDITGLHSFSTDESYFSKPSDLQGDEIDERSIKVIYNFIEWPEGQEDPIDKASLFSNVEIKKMHFSQFGLQTFLKGRNVKRV